MPNLLFIYGTLHPDRAPAVIAATARLLRPYCGVEGGSTNRATLCGRVHDFGAYPGLILSDDSALTVSGELFLLPDEPAATAVLACLDDYEDFRPKDPAASLFLRQKVRATLQEGPEAGAEVACWVYTYNRSLPK